MKALILRKLTHRERCFDKGGVFFSSHTGLGEHYLFRNTHFCKQGSRNILFYTVHRKDLHSWVYINTYSRRRCPHICQILLLTDYIHTLKNKRCDGTIMELRDVIHLSFSSDATQITTQVQVGSYTKLAFGNALLIISFENGIFPHIGMAKNFRI